MESRQSSATSSATQHDQASQQATTRQNKNDRGMARRDPYALMSPFALLQRFLAEDIANLFGNSRRRPATTNGRAGERSPWAPNVDVGQRGNELVVRADLPGVTPDEVTVEVSDDAITLSGQRGEERVEDVASQHQGESPLTRSGSSKDAGCGRLRRLRTC